MSIREPVEADPAQEQRSGHARRRGPVLALAFTAALAVGAVLRLWELASKPDWQYDETVYTTVAANVLRHGTLSEHPMVNTPWSPFLYQPPLYFLTLSRWFEATGVSIYHARIFGVLCALAGLTMLWRLLIRLRGPQVALAAIVPVIFDGWLLYIQRCSYMENVLLMLIIAGMLLYQRALEKPTAERFALVGAVIGLAVVVKYTAIYVIVAVLLCWLIRRRDHRGHLVLLGIVALVAAADVWIMLRLFDVSGHDWFIQENIVQIRRVLGLQKSGGTLTSPAAALHLLFAQYRVFIPSLLLGVGAFAIGVRRLWACYRARNWEPLRGNALLWSWMAAGVLVFGFSSLRFPQYFALILVPMYCYLWTEIWTWDREARLKLAAGGLAVVAGLGSFYGRVVAHDGNAFASIQRYAAARIPPHAIVVTEETIGDLIQQPWCRVEVVDACRYSASYAITWKTYLQSSFALGGAPFDAMMRGATPLVSFSDFSGTATVWRLK